MKKNKIYGYVAAKYTSKIGELGLEKEMIYVHFGACKISEDGKTMTINGWRTRKENVEIEVKKYIKRNKTLFKYGRLNIEDAAAVGLINALKNGEKGTFNIPLEENNKNIEYEEVNNKEAEEVIKTIKNMEEKP